MRLKTFLLTLAFCVVVGLSGFVLLGNSKTSVFFYSASPPVPKETQDTPSSEPSTNIVLHAPPVIKAAAVVPSSAVLLPIFMYHHVGALPANTDPIRTDLTVSTETFESEVQWLSQQGYHTITLEDLYLYTKGKFALPSKPIIFTFDDGYDDVFQNAVPILQKYGFVGSFAIISQFPGTVNGTNTYATWQQIDAAKLNGMEIVSHTQNHFDGDAPQFDAAYIEKNLTGSIEDLRKHLGLTTNILVYPYGHYNATYLGAAAKSGVVMGVTTRESAFVDSKNLMEVPRIRVHGQESLDTFKKILEDATYRPTAKNQGE